MFFAHAPQSSCETSTLERTWSSIGQPADLSLPPARADANAAHARSASAIADVFMAPAIIAKIAADYLAEISYIIVGAFAPSPAATAAVNEYAPLSYDAGTVLRRVPSDASA